MRLLALLVCIWVFSSPVNANNVPSTSVSTLKLGVLSFRPSAETRAQWQPLADYLSHSLPHHLIELVPAAYGDLDQLILRGEVDLILTNPSHYISLRTQHSLTGVLATLVLEEQGHALHHFGGIVAVRDDRADLLAFEDLRGQRIAAVGEFSVAGYQAQALELLSLGIDPARDMQVSFVGVPHDQGLQLLIGGAVDAAFVRSGVLEAMQANGVPGIEKVRVLQPQGVDNYPFALSTRLYPEWPFIIQPHVGHGVAVQISSALLGLEADSDTARQAGIVGFTVPADYAPVEEMMRALKIKPFDQVDVPTLDAIWHNYSHQILVMIALLLGVLVAGVILVRANRRIAKTRVELQLANRLLVANESLLKTLNGELSHLKGGEFFSALARTLVGNLKADFAFVGVLEPHAHQVRVEQGCSAEGMLSAFTYELNGTPCERLTHEPSCVYADQVQALFPDDRLLQEMQISAYLGYQLQDKLGKPLGILVVLYRQPLSEVQVREAQSLLGLCYERVASELQRDLADRASQQQLKLQQILARTSLSLPVTDSDERFDADLEQTLADFGRLLGVDRCYLFHFDERQLHISCTHDWYTEGIEPYAPRVSNLSVENVDWWRQTLLSDGKVVINSVAALPDLAAAERTLFSEMGLQALLDVAMYGNEGSLIGFVGVASHTHERRWSESEQLYLHTLAGVLGSILERRRSEQHLRLAASVFEHANEGIVITDAQGSILDVNQAFTDITGYSREELIGRNPRLLQSGHHSQVFYQQLWQTLRDTGQWSGEIWNKRKSGEPYAEMLTISAVQDANGQVQSYVGLVSDITHIKTHQQQLEKIAHYDALTQLPNRVLLSDRLHQAMTQAQRREELLAVVYMDLDGFKAVNDCHGHDGGDRLLISLAKRLKAALREGDTLARIGGDEFVVLLLDLPDRDTAFPLLKRLLRVAAESVEDGAALLQVSASLGVTFYPQGDAIDADQLLRQADQAMYQAKQLGKNTYFLFDAQQDCAQRVRYEALSRIQQALSQDEFRLYYQPKVHMRTGEVIGMEALIRWQHPERGVLAPAAFLPLLEGHPMMLELGNWVLEAALCQIARWRGMGLALPVSINVDAVQLGQSDFVHTLSQALARHPDVRPQDLELEVVETSALHDVAQASSIIHQCHQLGIRLSLDDFGTGYSSLAYLKQLPVDCLKVDQGFVRDMLQDPDDLVILEGVIGLADAFRRQILAEGVETPEHGEMLLYMGCDYAQGYAIARPMPAEAVPQWLEEWQPYAGWTQCMPLQRQAWPSMLAMVEHRAWMIQLKGFLEGAHGCAPELNHHACNFGRLLDQAQREQMGGESSQAVLQRINQLHCELHRHAEALVAQVYEGRILIAAELAELEQLHTQLNDLLRAQLTMGLFSRT